MLVGRSELERGDPPMGVASGRFEPVEAFRSLRNAMRPARDGGGKDQSDIRVLSGLSEYRPSASFAPTELARKVTIARLH
jgi:hypothetical protein